MRRDYGPDVLADGGRRGRRREPPQVPAERGLVVEEAGGGFCGAVVACEKNAVTLEDRFGRQRVFPLARAGFLVEGTPVTLVRPMPAAPRPRGPARTASGSLASPSTAGGQGGRARVARASRIYVEGRHDAELVEKIWGDDLREVGVVVEYLEGVDHLPAIVGSFSPGPRRRLGVLVDHLVPGSKESRIAAGRHRGACTGGGPPVRRYLAGREAGRGRHRRLARGPAGNTLEGRDPAGAGLGRRHRRRLEADPGGRAQLRRPGTRTPRPGGRADRLRHRAGY